MKNLIRHFRNYWKDYSLLLIGLILINYPLLESCLWKNSCNLKSFDDYKITFEAYVTISVSLLTAVFVFTTLNHQIRASELQNFQNKLFEMIEFHRENVSEFQLGRFKGRSIFIPMLREYRILLRIVKKEIERLNLIYNDEEVVNISYLIFFYGVGNTSTKILTNVLAHYPKSLIKKLIIKLQDPKTTKKVRKKSKLSYIPFQGHQSRLGHYYRNLYAIVKFVHYQSINIDKYEYVRNIRSQLSNHEQALLLINIISDIGLTWKKEFFLEKYRLVRNIPKGFFNESKEFDPTHYLPAKDMEYNDIEVLRVK